MIVRFVHIWSAIVIFGQKGVSSAIDVGQSVSMLMPWAGNDLATRESSNYLSQEMVSYVFKPIYLPEEKNCYSHREVGENIYIFFYLLTSI